MGNVSYKQRYEAEKRRWEELREHLEMCVEMADTFNTGAINYDKNTVLQVLFKMDSMKY
jgi:hypothetical protein